MAPALPLFEPGKNETPPPGSTQKPPARTTQTNESIHRFQKVAETNRLIRERNAALTETKHLYDSQMNDNKQNERKLTAANRQAAKLRQELKEREKNYLELKDEVNIFPAETVNSFDLFDTFAGKKLQNLAG